jgi:hypothetical protein
MNKPYVRLDRDNAVVLLQACCHWCAMWTQTA